MNNHHHDLDFSQITESLFVGTNQCCQSHFSEKLLTLGITVDVSLEEERVDAPFGVESYLWLPVKDHTPPSDDQLKIGVDFIASAFALGKKAYIHCKNGHGRGPTLAISYLISTGMTVDDAVTLLREKRPVIHLEESQIGALDRFSEKIYAQQKTN